jgi:putative component of membrane protein insertase Oxa1/YidC/SpoIIIJ protein YidD
MRYLILFGFFIVFSVGASASDEPWEPEDRVAPAEMFENSEEKADDLSTGLVRNLVTYYQSTQSKASISRCPFYTSCSFFFSRAVEVYGLPIGTLAFLDRYLYRENFSAYKNYSLKRRPDGVYKLDDEYYLSP